VVEQNEFLKAIDKIKNSVQKLTSFQCCSFNFANKSNQNDEFEALLRSNTPYKCFFVNNHVSVENILSKFNKIIFFEISKYSYEDTKLFGKLKACCKKLKFNFAEFKFYDLVLKDNIQHFNDRDISITDNSKNIIVSKDFLEKNINLIEKFEEKFTIFVRDEVSRFKSSANETNISQDIDILLDEFTGIKILDFESISQEKIHLILKAFSMIKLKVNFFYIFIVKSRSDQNFDSKIIFNQSILARFCSDTNVIFSKENNTCQTKIIYLDNSVHIHEFIEEIFSSRYRKAFMLTYYPLSKNPSTEERFLLNSGLNSFIAQYLLTNHSLSELLKMTFEEFTSRFKLINNEMAKRFFRSIDS
jgi:hypothetical protein